MDTTTRRLTHEQLRFQGYHPLDQLPAWVRERIISPPSPLRIDDFARRYWRLDFNSQDLAEEYQPELVRGEL